MNIGPGTRIAPARSTAAGLSRPQYRLRVDEARVYYDVSENRVEVLAIIMKSDAEP